MKHLLGPGQSLEKRDSANGQQAGLAAAPPAVEYYAEPSSEGLSLRDHLRSIRRHLGLVVGLTLFLTTGVGVYLAFKPDIYEAEAQVQVNLENINPQLSGMKGGSFIVNPVNDPAYFNTQLQLLVRPWLLRRVIKTLNIENEPSYRFGPHRSPSLLATFSKALGFNKNQSSLDLTQESVEHGAVTAEELAEAARLEPYVETLQLNLSVQPVKETRLPIKETRLINIGFSHTDPQIAARVVNTLAETFVRSNLENKNDLNAMTRDILQKRITELQTQVRSGEEQLVNYAKNHEIISLDPSQNTVVERLAGLNRQLLEAENERKLAEASYKAALTPGAAEALAETEKTREDLEPQNRLADLRQRRAQLLVESTEEWPEVKEIDQQIAALENFVAKSRERAGSVVRTNLETKYKQALAREQALRAAFNQQRSETLKQNESAIYYRIMQQEVDTGKQLLDGLLQRQKENDNLLAGMINNIRVNDYAVVPRVPIGPRRLLYTAIAFVVSLVFSVGLSILIDYMDNTVRSPEDVEKTLHTRTLASIPSMSTVLQNQGLQLSDNSTIGAGIRSRLLSMPHPLRYLRGNGSNHKPLLLQGDEDSWLNEVYRQLRTSILLSHSTGPLQTILIVSSLPGEGKTTNAINTALSLARTGARVLLIDGDSRNPRVHKLLGLENDWGFTTILTTGNRAHFSSLVRQHEPSGLFVLTSGPPEPNFTELLGSEQMNYLINDLKASFSYIIIDSPPVAHFADGILMSQLVDGVVFVVNSGKTPQEVVKQSKQTLHDIGANVIGVILNNVKIFPYDYNYYPKYYTKRNRHSDSKPEDIDSATAPAGLLPSDEYGVNRFMNRYRSGPADPSNG